MKKSVRQAIAWIEGFCNEKQFQVVKKLMDVIVFGTITKAIPVKQTVHLQKDGFEAVISQNWNGDKVNWLLTGWKQIKTPTVSNP